MSDKMRELLNRARSTLESYADPSGYTDNEGEPFTADDAHHPGALAAATLAEIDEALAAIPTTDAGGKSLAAFVETIHQNAPNGDWIAVKHHSNGDWSVAHHPLSTDVGARTSSRPLWRPSGAR